MPSVGRIKAAVLRKLALSLVALLVPAILLLLLSYHAYAVYVNLYTAAASAAALLSGLELLRSYRGSPKSAVHPLRFLVTGVALWVLAETIFLCFIILYGEAPELSVSDLLWLSGYPFLLLGLWAISKPFTSRLKLLGASTSGALKVIIGAVILSALVVTAQARIVAGEAFTLAEIIDSSYIVLDALLLITALSAASTFRAGTLGIAYQLVAVGFALLSVADLLYFLASTYVFAPADFLYASSYVVVAIGLQTQRTLIEEA